MIDIDSLLKVNPELANCIKIELTLADLLAFGESIQRAAKEEEKRNRDSKDEEYYTTQHLADLLNVSLVTIWSWDRKGILSPLRIGNAKRYRRSDIEKILNRVS